MLFHDPRFKSVAEVVIDAAPVPCALVGGAVRDEVNGRNIKDFDIIVHQLHADQLIRYLDNIGFREYARMDTYEYYERLNNDLKQTFTDLYLDWSKLTLGDIKLDILILNGTYSASDNVSSNFKRVVSLFDNTMHQWMYYAGTLSFLGGNASDKQAQQLLDVDLERELHTISIAKELGWTYVPLSK